MNLNIKVRDENKYDAIVAGTEWLFNYSGVSWLMQYWTRQVTKEAYGHLTSNRSYCSDEVQGLMGSLTVLLKTGLDPNKEWGSHTDKVSPSMSNK